MRPTVLAWWIWAVIALGMILLPLVGCSGPFKGVCAVHPIGQTDSGIAVARVYCEPE